MPSAGIVISSCTERRLRRMAKKEIELSIQHPLMVGNVDVAFRVWNGPLLGTLTLSKGTVDWRPANKRKAVSKTWEEFNDLMR